MKYRYQRVRDLREDKDFTQQELAHYLNLHITQYRRYESGELEIPVHVLLQLKQLYNTTLDYLTEIVITTE